MNAADTAAALAARAEALCRKYLANGCKQGRYWTAGDVRGAKGRSLFVRLAPPGIPGKWTDAADGTHGDLLDLIRLSTGAASLREALAEAHRFLAQPVPPTPSHRDGYDRAEAARNLWRRCRPIENTHGEAYLHARAIRTCRFPALRFQRRPESTRNRTPRPAPGDADDSTPVIDSDGCADEKRMKHSVENFFLPL